MRTDYFITLVLQTVSQSLYALVSDEVCGRIGLSNQAGLDPRQKFRKGLESSFFRSGEEMRTD